MKKLALALAVLAICFLAAAPLFSASLEDLPPPRDGEGVIGNSRTGDSWGHMYATKVVRLKVHQLPLTEAYIDTGTDALMGLDGTTAPGMALHDSLPKAVWADSSENGKVNWTFMLPDLTVTVPPGMTSSEIPYFVIKVMVSCAADQSVAMDGMLYINEPTTAFNSGYALDAVTVADTADANTKNTVITLELTTAAKAALTTTGVYTLQLWNTSVGAGDLEALHAWIEYK